MAMIEHFRTATYGPVRVVVWEGPKGPYPDQKAQSAFSAKRRLDCFATLAMTRKNLSVEGRI